MARNRTVSSAGFRTLLHRLARCKRGNSLVIIAAAAPLLIGASAVGVDTIQLTLAKRQLQRSADSAAMAGAYNVAQGRGAASGVERDLALNNGMTLANVPVVENAPTVGSHAGDARAVRVVLTATRSVPFITFFTGEPMTVQVEATAAAVPNGRFCVISLESTAVTGITFGGSADIDLGCGVATNSSASSAVQVNGNPTVRATPISAVGGLPPASRFTGDTQILPYSPVQPDPFAQISDPVLPATCQNRVSIGPNDTATLSPGCYRGMDLKGNVTLNPGVYYIDGDSLSFGSQANVSGNGVAFVLTSRNAVSNPSSIADIDMNGGATLNLTAPTTGEYAGLLFYQDRRAPFQDSHINGNSSSRLDGSFYFPGQQLTFNGNTGMLVQCLRLVARRVAFSGNSNLVNTCPANSPQRGYEGVTIRLVG
jgi:Flp pilus assembly protein TadG